jgi:hypothetical protein
MYQIKGAAVRVAFLQPSREHRGGVTMQAELVKCNCQLRGGISVFPDVSPRYGIYGNIAKNNFRAVLPEAINRSGTAYIRLRGILPGGVFCADISKVRSVYVI